MPSLIRGFILLLFFVFHINTCYSYELILPKEKVKNVTSDYILFIGKAGNSEFITINNERVYVSSNGAFAHSVKLKNGENRILVRSNYNTQVYKINKKNPVQAQKSSFIELNKSIFYVEKDNTPLRSTPLDSGMNRISHLFKNTELVIDGEQGIFYRVYLSKDKYAWVLKKDVSKIENNKSKSVANFIDMNSQKYKNAYVQTIKFSKNLPYTVEIQEKEILFKIYNPELSDNSVYTLNLPKPKKYFYKVTLEDGCYTFKVSKLPESIEECTIIIDAGHGGTEKGAIGCLGDMEKDINLKIALELQKILNNFGANVIMTRACDGNISLEDRVKIAKENNANIFISIHLNSIGDIPINVRKNRGTSIYYYNPEAKQLAEILEKSISKTAGTKKDGVKEASFAVIRPSEYVGVLVEAAYMINPMDTLLYLSKDFATDVAKGIANGIKEFLEAE